MAGGKGKRMSSLFSDIPKPMIPINGKPILQYQIECLVKYHLRNIIIAIGYLGYKIKDYFKDGSNFGCSISYYEEKEPLGSGGALYKIINELDNDFLLINGDIIFDIDFHRFIDFYHQTKAWAILAVHPNNHPYDSALLFIDHENKVTKWINKEESRSYYKNMVNSGIHLLSKQLLLSFTHVSENIDLDRDILKPCISTGKIFAYPTPEYIKDIGTPERYNQVSLDIAKGLIENRNLSNKQKAIFIDRDGTLNKFNDFITKPDDFILIDGVSEAINNINNSGYLAIVITNQPVIARGDCSIEELNLIHQKMETDLGNDGAYIDDLFYCPHHPDKGFPGERPEFKINCSCRKPKPGLILSAAGKYNIDLQNSYMVGDDIRDIQAGISAGCIPILLDKDLSKQKLPNDLRYVKVYSNLLEFVKSCLL